MTLSKTKPYKAGAVSLSISLFLATQSAAWQSCPEALWRAAGNGAAPFDLLVSIAVVESAKSQDEAPWPWAVGTPTRRYYPSSKAQAIKLVQHLYRQGKRNIDVGCMQVNLRAHPNAFKDLNDAFDPEANVAFGAGYLQKLYKVHKAWSSAVSHYHSRTPHRQRLYTQKIQNILPKLSQKPWVQALKQRLSPNLLLARARNGGAQKKGPLPDLYLTKEAYGRIKQIQNIQKNPARVSRQVPKHFIH